MPRVEVIACIMLRSGGRTEVPTTGRIDSLYSFDEVDRIHRRQKRILLNTNTQSSMQDCARTDIGVDHIISRLWLIKTANAMRAVNWH